MNAITCCCAPAPIDNIDSTAATPKIIPSIVSSVRSLWSSRLSMLRPRSGSHSAVVARREGRGRHGAARGVAGDAGALRPAAARRVRVDERDLGRFVEALDARRPCW